MTIQKHGGDTVAYQREYGAPPLDFSVNISPLGLPEGVRTAVLASLDTAPGYPDPLCRELREKLGAFHRIDAGQIVCGSGAAELIHRLVQLLRPRRALLTVPGFGEYRAALEAVGCRIETHTLTADNGFALTESILPRIRPGLELLFLCSPDNPSGRLIDRQLLRAVLARCRESGTLLVLDECFVDFTDDPEKHTLHSLLPESRELVILRAFTKTYAMAGLRLGYALCGDRDLARRLGAWGQPWAVSSVAQAAGLAALDEREYVQTLRKLISAQRSCLLAALQALGLRVVPGEANFLLWRSERTDLFEALCHRGILTRSCVSFAGLDAHWLRTAVRSREENEILIQALKEVLANG